MVNLRGQDTLAVGVIGAGFWARFQVAAWLEVPGVRVAAICDRRLDKAQALADEFRIGGVYTDAAEMFDRESVDCVDIATGPESHHELVLLAASRQKPVICQKPMALDYQTSKAMADACEAAGLPFLIHENFRWQKPMRRIRQILDARVIGTPFRAHIQLSHGGMDAIRNQPYLFEQPDFALLDMGPHVLDLALFFMGEPCTLYARQHRIQPGFAGADIVSIQLGYENAYCHCELTWRISGYEVFIEGSHGAVSSSADGTITTEQDSETTTERIEAPQYSWSDPAYGFAHSSIVAANAHIVDVLTGRAEPETPASCYLEIMRLIDLAKDSARRGETLKI